MAKNDFQYGGWNYYTLQYGMWLWNHDSELTKSQHPAMWYVGLGSWHWIRHVAAPCNVAGGYGMTYCDIPYMLWDDGEQAAA